MLVCSKTGMRKEGQSFLIRYVPSTSKDQNTDKNSLLHFIPLDIN